VHLHPNLGAKQLYDLFMALCKRIFSRRCAQLRARSDRQTTVSRLLPEIHRKSSS